MISKQEFKELFAQKFMTQQKRFKRNRIFTIVWLLFFTCATIACSVLAHHFFDPENEHILLNILICIMSWLVIAVAPAIGFKDKLLKNIKKVDLGQILKIIYGENVVYDQAAFISEDFFRGSFFSIEKYDKFSGEDYFSVSINRKTPSGAVSTKFEASDVFLIRKEKQKNITTEKTIFSGVVCAVIFREEFKCKLRLNCADNSHLEKLETESSDFNKTFMPHTDNQVQARLILSVTTMQRLLDFQQKAKCKVGLSFSGNCLYVYLNKNLFEFSKKDGKFDFDLVEPIYDDLSLIDSLVCEITNNRKIFRI